MRAGKTVLSSVLAMGYELKTFLVFQRIVLAFSDLHLIIRA